MSLNGSFNVTRRAKRSYEHFHRDKRRNGVDRLAMLESRTAPAVRRSSGLRGLFSALGGLLRRR